MTELSDLELDTRLADLERDLGPTLRRVYRATPPMRAGLLADTRKWATTARPPLRLLPWRMWTAVAAVLVGGLVVSAAVFAYRPQPVSASEVIDQLQTEAMSVAVAGPACGAGTRTSGAVIAIQTGGPSTAPTTLTNQNDLSDRLAAALGVSSDQVRGAMLATVKAEMPSAPDPMERIAQELGVSRDQVCAALFDPATGGGQFVVSAKNISGGQTQSGSGSQVAFSGGQVSAGSGPQVEIGVPSKGVIHLDAATPDDVKNQAQQLGVSPERLLAALKASVPTSPPPKANPDEIIKRFAQKLGVPEDKARAAFAQVEGKNTFYFGVPLPDLGK